MKSLCVCALFLALLAFPAAAAPPLFRHGIAPYQPPPSWTRQENAGRLLLISPDKSTTLTFFPAKPVDPNLDALADALLAQVKTHPQFRQDQAKTTGKHIGSGGQWLDFAYSHVDPDHPEKFLYTFVYIISAGQGKAGTRTLTITATSTDAPALNKCIPAITKLVDSIQLTTTEILEPAPPASPDSPALSRYMVDETNDFLEWLLQTPLTDSQKETVELELRGDWRKNIRDQIDGMVEFLKARDQIADVTPAQRELVRQSVVDDIVKQWRTDKTSPSSQMMLQIYDNAHKPIAPGIPPLTRQSVDAFAEYLCFAAGQTVSTMLVLPPPPEELKARIAAEIAKNYASFPAQQRELIAGMPLTWATLRVAWPEISEADRQSLIAAWKKDPGIVQLGQAFPAPPPPAAASSDNLTPEDRALINSAEVKLAKHYYGDQAGDRMFKAVSNMMMDTHNTNMTIINNMGGGGWHYEPSFH